MAAGSEKDASFKFVRNFKEHFCGLDGPFWWCWALVACCCECLVGSSLGNPADIDVGEVCDYVWSNVCSFCCALGGRTLKPENCVSTAQARTDCMSGPPEELPFRASLVSFLEVLRRVAFFC